MEEEEFEESKQAVITFKLEKFKSMAEQFHTWNDEIRSHRFDKCTIQSLQLLLTIIGKLEAERLKSFTKADLLNFYNEYLHSSSPTRTTFQLKLYCQKFPIPNEDTLLNNGNVEYI